MPANSGTPCMRFNIAELARPSLTCIINVCIQRAKPSQAKIRGTLYEALKSFLGLRKRAVFVEYVQKNADYFGSNLLPLIIAKKINRKLHIKTEIQRVF